MESLAPVDEDVTDSEVEVDDDDSDQDQALDTLEEQSKDKIVEIRRVLMDQQDALKTILHQRQTEVARRAAEEEETATANAAAVIEARRKKEEEKRCCPMCEMPFPEKEVSIEDFEAHVMGHFSYEDNQHHRQSSLEGTTMRHYDLLTDVPTSFDGDFG